MHITINVADVDLDSVLETHHTEEDGPQEYTVRDAVIDEIARKMIVDRLGSEFTYELANRIRDIRNEIIRELITPIVTEAIEQTGQRTNSWGEPVGDPVNLRDVIIAEVKNVLTKREGYGRDGETYVQKIVREQVRSVVTNDLQAEIKAEAEKAKAAIRAKAADLIAEEAMRRGR